MPGFLPHSVHYCRPLSLSHVVSLHRPSADIIYMVCRVKDLKDSRGANNERQSLKTGDVQ